MLLLHFDPFTTEIVLKDVADPEVIANFTAFYVAADLQLTTGTVKVDDYLFIEEDVSMTLEEDATLELV